jgi:DNA integrity scanning protein DisA with diadenylate cyclase activity
MANGYRSRQNDELEFFQFCATHQQVRSDVAPRLTGVYDNRIGSIPEEAAAPFAAVALETRRNWFQNFLSKKFNYLRLRLEGIDSKQTICALVGAEDGNAEWESILAIWEMEASKERIAYLYRISQHDINDVHEQWYNQLPEFEEWARLCRVQLDDRWHEFLLQPLLQSYTNLLVGITKPGDNISFEDASVLDRTHARAIGAFERKTSRILSRLTGFDSDKEVVEFLADYCTQVTDTDSDPRTHPLSLSSRSANAVTRAFLDMIEGGENDPDRYLSQFGKEIANVFLCKVCDYLVVVGNGNMMRIHSTSLDISEHALRRRLAETEFYRRGEGISGSILVNPQPQKRFHVGTNNLAEDARQSPWHETAYKEVYGPTYDFWVFPLFDGNRIDAAFRVINRQSDGQTPVGYWPYYVRLQLLETAQWFEVFWKFIRSYLLKANTNQLSSAFGHRRASEQLRDAFGAHWIERGFLDNALAHLCTVVHRRIEDERVGCCIGIVQPEEMEILVATLGPYITVDTAEIRNLEDASNYYSRVFPTAGMFTFSGDSGFRGVLELQTADGRRGEECILSLSERFNCIVLLVQKGRESIRMYHQGSLAAEYYLSHGTGAWKLRFFNKTLEDIKEAVPWIRPMVLKRVYSEAWRLSNLGIGAMIVVVKEDLPGMVVITKTIRIEQPIDKFSEEEFADLAKIDGAVLITSRGIVQKGGTMFNLDREINLSQVMESRIGYAQKGNRHLTAARLSTAVGDGALVLTISKNRGISVFYRGESLVWDL